jgi:arsenate reductase
MNTVIFACVGSAGRSQMAAAFFNALADPARARARAAGTQPADRVHPEVVRAMREVGIDLSAARPTLLSEALAREAQLLITMGCGESCPIPACAESTGTWPTRRGGLQRRCGQSAMTFAIGSRGWCRTRGGSGLRRDDGPAIARGRPGDLSSGPSRP